MANISHLGKSSVLTQQTELSQSNTHMNYVYVVKKGKEQYTWIINNNNNNNRYMNAKNDIYNYKYTEIY